MSDKRLDLSVLPDGFLIEYGIPDDTGRTQFNDLAKFNIGWVEDELSPFKQKFRPALNHWHFNDGSMVLPDGLVVEAQIRRGRFYLGITNRNEIFSRIKPHKTLALDLQWDVNEWGHSDFDPIAVKILGVDPDYEKHGAELGMEVIEV